MSRLLTRFTMLSTGLLLSLAMAIAPNAAIAQRFNAPGVGAPGNREAGASRSAICATSDRGLVALMPETNLGLTTAAYPKFFFYVPPNSAELGEFALYEDDNNELVYSATFALPETPGIVSIAFPEGGTVPSALEVGQTYYWIFAVICDTQDRTADITVEGSVQRVALDSGIATQLQTAPPEMEPSIYADKGIWQEAVSSLAELVRTNPQDINARSGWLSLLQSVGLGSLANEPLL